MWLGRNTARLTSLSIPLLLPTSKRSRGGSLRSLGQGFRAVPSHLLPFADRANEQHASILGDNASILTMTAYGSEKVLPGYGLMGVAKAALEASVRYLAADLGDRGIRVNAISAGPLRTLSSAGVPAFNEIKRWNAPNNLCCAGT